MTIRSQDLLWRPAFFLAACALLLAILSIYDISPVLFLARQLSTDGILSDAYRERILNEQFIFAAILFLTSPLALIGNHISNRLKEGLCCIPYRLFILTLAFAAFVLTLLIQVLLFDNMPHVTDAISHFFQAKIIAVGHTRAPLPPCFEHFFQSHVVMTSDGYWFTKYTPGQPLYLTLGLLIGMPWLMGPLASAVVVLCFASIIQRFYTTIETRVATLLLVVSPLSILLGASFMSHTTFMMFSLLSIALGLHSVVDTISRWRRALSAAAAGLFFGMAGISRPHELVFLGLIAASGFLTLQRKRGLAARQCILPFVMGLAVPALVFALWNKAVYGEYIALSYGITRTNFIYEMSQGGYGLSDNYTIQDALSITMHSIARLNRALFGWPASLLFVPLAFATRRQNKRALLALLCTVAVVLFYFFYNYYGSEFEARYYYIALPFLLLLTVSGIKQTFHLLSRIRLMGSTRGKSEKSAVSLLTIFLLACTLHGFFSYWPKTIWPAYALDYEQATPMVHELARKNGLTDALILIPSEGEAHFRYSSGFAWNDPWLEGDIVYARDLPARNDCLFTHFPSRSIYRFVPSADWLSGTFQLLKAPGKTR